MKDLIWGEMDKLAETPVKREIGPLKIWFRKIYNEIWIAHNYQDKTELNWSRWVMKSSDFTIKITPVFPDKPIIVRPEYPFRITKNARAKVYTTIPVWVRISPADNNQNILTEIPVQVLSKTWFGDPVDGELCYWISTTARRQVENTDIDKYKAICPLNIQNKSDSDLQVEKICFRVDRLTMFQSNTQLWADDTQITYRGSEQHSDIVMSGKAPKELTGSVRLCEPRNTIKKSIATRTFQRLKEIPLFGE